MLVLLRLLTHKFILPGCFCCTSQCLDPPLSILPLCRVQGCSLLAEIRAFGDVAIKKRQVVPEGKGSTRNKKFQPWITVSIPQCWASLLLSASISWRSWVWLSSHQTRSQPLPPPPHSTLSVRFPTFMATCNTQNRNWKLNNGPPILLIAKRGWRIICWPHY